MALSFLENPVEGENSISITHKTFLYWMTSPEMEHDSLAPPAGLGDQAIHLFQEDPSAATKE